MSKSGINRNSMTRFVGVVCEAEAGNPRLFCSPNPESIDGCLILFRGFLANRSELIATLFAGDRPPNVTDPSLLVRAYRRWGDALQRRVLGEYIVAIFDKAARELLLTTDALGCLPAFHTN